MTNTFKFVFFSDSSIIEQNIIPIVNIEGKEDFGIVLAVSTGYACVEVVLDYIELKNAIKHMQENFGND